jgi:hypothetical protein
MDDGACERMSLQLLIRRVLVLAAVIQLRESKARVVAGALRADLERIERELMDWATKNWPLKDDTDNEISWSFYGEVLRYCDLSHYTAERVADLTGNGMRWAINNAYLRGDPTIGHYARKWELGWKRFLPWNW